MRGARASETAALTDLASVQQETSPRPGPHPNTSTTTTGQLLTRLVHPTILRR